MRIVNIEFRYCHVNCAGGGGAQASLFKLHRPRHSKRQRLRVCGIGLLELSGDGLGRRNNCEFRSGSIQTAANLPANGNPASLSPAFGMVNEHVHHSGDVDMISGLDAIEEELKTLVLMRANIDSGAVKSVDAIKYYQKTITHILELGFVAAKKANDAELGYCRKV